MSIELSSFIDQEERVYHFKGEISKEHVTINSDEFKIVAPILYDGAIYRIEGEYSIDINIVYQYETRCARCLNKTVKKINTTLDGKLVDKGSNDNMDGDLAEDENVIFYQGDLLDIDQYVLMEVSSSLPMKTLCTDECKGICPQCGVDFNKGNCNCVENDIDPRFEKLKDLFVED